MVEPEVAFRGDQEQKKNMNTKIELALLAVSGVLVAASPFAQASILTDYIDVTPSSSGGSGITFSLPSFDPSLGTLNSVELTLTPVLGAFGNDALNLSGSSLTVPGPGLPYPTEAIGGTGSLNNSTLGISATYLTTSGALTSPTFTAVPGITDGPGLPYNWTIASSSAGVTAAGYSALGGSLAFVGVNPQFTSTGGDGTYYIGGYGNVGGDLEVDFNYTAAPAVPEPTTIISGMLMLLPFGASTLRIIRRNRMA